MRMIDLSRELYHRTPTYPGQPPIIHGTWKTHEESFVESGNVHGNCVMFFSMPDHGGTHIDSMRPGPMGAVNSLVHKACLELDITHIESLCNLEALIGQGEFRFIGLPLKWRGGTGSPIRAVAVFED